MGIELRPCPFCGREPAVADIIGGGHAYWVDCYQCETSGPVVVGGDLSSAADAWNRRQSDAATARAEAAEQRAEAAEAALAAAQAERAEAEKAVAVALDARADLEAGLIAARADLDEARAEVARLRAAWTDAVAEVAATGTEPDLGGLALTPRRSPATMKALREVAQMLAEAQPAEVTDG